MVSILQLVPGFSEFRDHLVISFSYPEPFLRAVRRGALAKSITGYHKNMVRKQCPVLELVNQMPVRNMDLARAPRRTARKKGSGYENAGYIYRYKAC